MLITNLQAERSYASTPSLSPSSPIEAISYPTSQASALVPPGYPMANIGNLLPLVFPSLPLEAKPENIRVLSTFTGHTKDVPCIALSVHGDLLASSSLDQTVKLWNMQTGQLLSLPVESEKVERPPCMTLSANGNILAYTYNDQSGYYGCHIWNIQNAQLVGNLGGFHGHLTHILLGADGLVLMCKDGSRADDFIKIYNLHMDIIRPQKKWRGASACFALTLNGLWLAFGEKWGGGIANTQTGEILGQFGDKRKQQTITSLAFNADGSILASGGLDGVICLWRVQANKAKLLRTFSCATKSIALTPDGKVLISASYGEKNILLWDTTSGKLLHTLQNPTGIVSSIVLSADGRVLASGGSDGTITIWGIRP